MHSINHILVATIATERQRAASDARLARATRAGELALRHRPPRLRAAAAAVVALGQR